jgi:osmoprotectant transport system permease protein
MYALLAIVRNTVSGLNSVSSAVSESAKGMGMGYWQRLLRIEMPIAWPVILAGIRVSTQLTVGIAAVAALVGGDNLGTLIFGGIRRLGSSGSFEQMLGGTLGIVILAFLFDLLFLGIGRITTSRGIRD